MGARKKYTDEEREKKKKENWFLKQRPKEIEEHKRLKPIRIEDEYGVIKTKTQWREFKKEIRERNSKRFDEIFGNQQLWESLNTSSEIWMIKKERQERRKRSGKGKWIDEKDVDRAMRVIYGGEKGEIIQFEDDDIKPFENPYTQNEEE